MMWLGKAWSIYRRYYLKTIKGWKLEVAGWAPGTHMGKMDAKKAWEERLSQGDFVTNEEMWEFAKTHLDSEWHKGFEWDKDKAFEIYGINRAGEISRAFVFKHEIVDRKGDKQINIIRAQESIVVNGVHGYVPSNIIKQDPEMAQYVIDNIKRDFAELKQKGAKWAEYISDINGFNNGIDSAVGSLVSARRKKAG
jgi:hypothetical protein